MLIQIEIGKAQHKAAIPICVAIEASDIRMIELVAGNITYSYNIHVMYNDGTTILIAPWQKETGSDPVVWNEQEAAGKLADIVAKITSQQPVQSP